MSEEYSKSFSVKGKNFHDAGKISTEIKTILKQLGINAGLIRRIAIASYEAEMNVVMYAKQATLNLEVTPQHICLEFEDEGPGIENIELAMQEGYSTATREMREMGFGAGMGLPNIKKNADELHITSTVGKGTRLVFSFRLSV